MEVLEKKLILILYNDDKFFFIEIRKKVGRFLNEMISVIVCLLI